MLRLLTVWFLGLGAELRHELLYASGSIHIDLGLFLLFARRIWEELGLSWA